jgi:2-polyprenyl-3-methyl-5-hydroxy-6-metoxy-1,4-benzoquinol methylase
MQWNQHSNKESREQEFMGTSDPANKPWATKKIIELDPTTVLDCGAGAGIYLDIVKQYVSDSVFVAGVEVWQPYIEQFNLKSRYNLIIEDDLRNIEDFNYDLVIFGDILEHMTEEEALKIWDKVSKQAKYAIISIPIIHYHQDAINGNPYEIHVDEDWSTERVLLKFSHIVEHKEFPQTGVFVAKFDKVDIE